ncbi:MAG: hypothetical protein ABSH39_07355 [Candidatus Acidiferrum sp.]|jgi:hypothetical protein
MKPSPTVKIFGCAADQVFRPVFQLVFRPIFLLLVLQPAVASGHAQSAAADFDSRVIENATIISGRTCSNPLVGVSYELPEGVQIRDAAATRIAKARGESGRTGIGPEAEYILWGSHERESIVLLCGGESERGQAMVTAVPMSVLSSYGPDGLEKLTEAASQAVGAQTAKRGLETVGGRAFHHVESHGAIPEEGGAQREVFISTYATEVNSYAVLWNFIAYASKDVKVFSAAMSTVKVQGAAAPVAATRKETGAGRTKQAAAPDFQRRLAEFMNAWLAERDQAKTLAFLDKSAYEAAPIIGTYCDGWYKSGTPPDKSRSIMASNLMGVPSGFPKKTTTQDIFKAWSSLPPEWTSEAANDIGKEHFLIAMLDHDSLGRLFRDQFRESGYRKFLEGAVEKHGTLYWAVFPERASDGDVFVVFTVWEKIGETWSITHVDVVCQ